METIRENMNDDNPVSVEIEGDRWSWFYVCGDCHGQVDWHDERCKHCGRRLDWNG